MMERIGAELDALSKRAKTALLLFWLWTVGLAVYGFIKSMEVWAAVAVGAGLVAAVVGAVYALWRRHVWKMQETHKREMADFIFWFLDKNNLNNLSMFHQIALSIPLKPLHDANEVLRATTAAYRKLVGVVECRLTLGHTPTEHDKANCVNLIEWLRTDAASYDAEHNRQGAGGFPRFYTIDVTISGQHLIIRCVVVDSLFAVHYAKDPPQAAVPEVTLEDDDFGQEPDGIPNDDEIL